MGAPRGVLSPREIVSDRTVELLFPSCSINSNQQYIYVPLLTCPSDVHGSPVCVRTSCARGRAIPWSSCGGPSRMPACRAPLPSWSEQPFLSSSVIICYTAACVRRPYEVGTSSTAAALHRRPNSGISTWLTGALTCLDGRVLGSNSDDGNLASADDYCRGNSRNNGLFRTLTAPEK